MNKSSFDDLVKRIQQVNTVIEKLDPAIRAAAFALLEDYVTGVTGTENGGGVAAARKAANGIDREEFFSKASDDKPSDNVDLAAAWHYHRHGAVPFSTKWVASIAREVGMTIPYRIDATLRMAKHEKKTLFTKAGKGKFKPTVHGEMYLRKVYGVSKGALPITDEVATT